jgi:type VI secretion system protein ImpF
MARQETQQGLMPSIIDRLIDPDSAGTKWRTGYGVPEMVAAVHRDLEDLLNTRTTDQGIPEGFAEVHSSIVGYGLPDLVSLNAVTASQRESIGRVIESVIEHYEPRLKDVRAHLLDPGDGKERTVRFRIDARLSVDPAPEVAFDTVLELTTGHYSVKPTGS